MKKFIQVEDKKCHKRWERVNSDDKVEYTDVRLHQNDKERWWRFEHLGWGYQLTTYKEDEFRKAIKHGLFCMAEAEKEDENTKGREDIHD